MPPWTPQWRHCTQFHPPDYSSGWNDCAEAGLARYLLEAYPHFGTGGEWALVEQVLDPKSPTTYWDLLDRLRVIGTGEHDQPGNPFTTAAQIDAMLAAYGIASTSVWGAGSYEAAYASPWALLNVDATLLAPPGYPASFLGGEGGQPNHLILWLPNDGHDNYFNDPLTYSPGIHQDVYYDLGSVRASLYGCWPLPDTGHGEIRPPGPPKLRVRKHAAVKANPDHGKEVVCSIEAGDLVTPLETREWRRVQLANGQTGWLLGSNLEPA